MTKKINLAEALKKAGLHATVVKVKLTPEQRKREKQIEKDVRNYVMGIERAHQKACKSTLVFKDSVLAPEFTQGLFYSTIDSSILKC